MQSCFRVERGLEQLDETSLCVRFSLLWFYVKIEVRMEKVECSHGLACRFVSRITDAVGIDFQRVNVPHGFPRRMAELSQQTPVVPKINPQPPRDREHPLAMGNLSKHLFIVQMGKKKSALLSVTRAATTLTNFECHKINHALQSGQLTRANPCFRLPHGPTGPPQAWGLVN